MSSHEKFRAWLTQATTQKSINGYLAFAWLGFGLYGLTNDAITTSIKCLFFISVYANVAGHWSGWQGGRTEVKQEQAIESGDSG